MIRITTMLLLSSLILTSCGSQGSQAETTTGTSETTTSAPTETTIGDDLPALNFDGKTFTVAVYENPDARNHVFSSEQDGDVINDAIYSATLAVEQRFNVELEEYLESDPTALNVREPIMAGDMSFHVANIRCPEALAMYAEGLFTDWSQLEYVNLEKPYWSRNINEALTLGGVTYTAIGDMSISAYDLTHVLLFNYKLLEDYKLDAPFELVRSGKWTLDKMSEMMKKVASDLDGNSTIDANDQFGYVSYARVSPMNFWIAGENKTVTKDTDDNYKLNLNNEKLIEYMTEVTNLLHGDNISWFEEVDGYFDAMPDWEIEIFTSNRALFANSTLKYMESLRNMDADFGIIPYPKADEAQENYHVRLGYYNAPVVPVTNNELEMTGALLEAINCEYSKTVRPAYFDISLKSKISRNEDSSEMLDLILDSRTIDVGDVLFASTIRATIWDQFKIGMTDFASAIAAQEATNEAALEAALRSN